MIYVIAVAIFLLYVFYSMVLSGKRANRRYKQMMKRSEVIENEKINDGSHLSLVIENGQEDTFADYTALYGYPNYLFRTDSRQVWTNEDITRDFCIWADELEVHWFTEDYPCRQELNQRLRKRFTELANGKSITRRRFFRRICFFNLWFVNDRMGLVNLELSDTVQALIMAMLHKLLAYEKIIPLCAVAHADEAISHVHFLYYIKPQYRDVPHIKKILTP